MVISYITSITGLTNREETRLPDVERLIDVEEPADIEILADTKALINAETLADIEREANVEREGLVDVKKKKMANVEGGRENLAAADG